MMVSSVDGKKKAGQQRSADIFPISEASSVESIIMNELPKSSELQIRRNVKINTLSPRAVDKYLIFPLNLIALFSNDLNHDMISVEKLLCADGLSFDCCPKII